MRLIASRIEVIQENALELIEKLDLPPWQEYKEAASVAFHDVWVATLSSCKFGHLTLRPLLILLGIVLQCLAVVLHIILENSIYHGWRAAKEFYYQLQIATVWFIQYQRNLSTSAIYAEIAFVSLIATLWLLRRHVRKHRYYERTLAWYEVRKQKALRKYNNFIDQVDKTSSFLALMMPHLVYIIFAAIIKYTIPWFVTYLATRTPINALIQYIHPLGYTIHIITEYTKHVRTYEVDKDDSKDKKVGSSKKPSSIKLQQKQKAELEKLRVEVAKILKYWVVYMIIIAFVQTGKLIPLVGNLFHVHVEDTVANGTLYQSIWSKLRFSSRIVEEMSLVFFIWLRFIPTPVAGRERASLKHKQNSPLGFCYTKVSSSVNFIMNSSSFLTNRAAGSHLGGGTVLSWCMGKLDSLLNVLVLLRTITQETKENIVRIILELSDLLPSLVFMLLPLPGCSTFGVISASLIVPVAHSIKSCNEIEKRTKGESAESKVEGGSRFLRFWVLHAAFSWILSSFQHILAWIPFSTHATWLLWAMLLLETTTRRIYGWFEDGKVIEFVEKLIATLPSNVDSQNSTSINEKVAEKSKDN